MTEISEQTPSIRGRKVSDITNSDFNLMNQKYMDMNLINQDPQLGCIIEDESPKYNKNNNNDGISQDEISEKESTLTRDLKFLQKMMYYFKFFSEFILRDFKQKPLNNVISVSTIVLLIVFLGFINIMMSLSPMIYLMMSEQDVGESDIIFINPSIAQTDLSHFNSNNIFLDYDIINDNFCNSYLKGCTSRYHIKGKTTVNSKDIFSDVLLIDVQKEENIGLGRRIQLQNLKEGECYISRSLYNDIKKAKGSSSSSSNQQSKGNEKLTLDFNLSLILSSLPMLQLEEVNESYSMRVNFIAKNIYEKLKKDNCRYEKVQDIIYYYYDKKNMGQEQITLLDEFDFNEFLPKNYNLGDHPTKEEREYSICLSIAEYAMNFKFSLNLKIKQVIDNSIGKYENKLSNVIIIDYKSQFQWMIEQICSSFISTLQENLRSYSMSYYILFKVKQQFLNELLLDYAENNIDKQFFQKKAMIIYGIYQNKQNIYLEEETIVNQLKQKSTEFFGVFGIEYQANLLFPLSYTQIINLKQKQILDNSYNSGVVLLIALSSVIIYSVSQSSIQQKVQEYGVVRIIGYSTKSLILFSLAKAILFYIIPALIFAELLNLITEYYIKSYFYDLLKFNNNLQQEYSSSYYATTVILGICLPLFCNLYPFKEFFEKQVLSQALNIHQRVLTQTKVIVQNLEKYGVSFYSLINAIILAVVGILAYYFAPYSFVTQKIGLFLLIVNLTFLMVNVGIACLVNIFQRKIEILWIRLSLKTCFRKDINLEQPIENNFKNNDLRMSKLGMIIMMIFSFYISIGSSVNSQIMMVKNMVKLNIGSDYLLQVERAELSLDEYTLTNKLEEFKSEYPNIIKGYSFVSKNLQSIPGFQSGARIKSFLGAYSKWDIVAIGPNFFDSIYSELFVPETPVFENQNPSNSLYFKNGTSQGTYREEETLDRKDPYYILTQISDGNYIMYSELIEHAYEQYIYLYISAKEKKFLSIDYMYHLDFILGSTRYKGYPVGFAKKMPGFKSFTENSIASLFESSQAFISFEQYNHILSVSLSIQGYSDSDLQDMRKRYPMNLTDDIPKDQLYVRLNDNIELTPSQRNALNNILTGSDKNEQKQSLQNDQESISFYQTYQILLSLDYLINFWNLLFNLISVFIFILTYYLLTITFKQNIQDNLHNIKIFKSIGLSHQQISKIFIYEGATVMIVNGVIGLAIGMGLSIMIQQQLIVFLEMPMDLSQIPYSITIILLISCIILSIFTSKREIDFFKNKQISQIDK